MSLFEHDLYQWRETFLVLLTRDSRPTANAMRQILAQLDSRYEIENLRETEDGLFESCTVYSPHDFAAMDISYTDGSEVLEQVNELKDSLTNLEDTPEEQAKFRKLDSCDARLDVFHFEQRVIDTDSEDEDEYLDPGSVLIVLEHLATLCDGVCVDPQSGAVL